MSLAPVRLTLYSKPGCHLCDEMKEVVLAVRTRAPLTLEVIDISNDPYLDRSLRARDPGTAD